MPTCHLLSIPTSFLSLPGLARVRHDDPEPPPAATSSSRWNAHPRALTPSLSRAAAALQRLHSILLLPVPNSEHPIHNSPPPSSSAPATHGTPVDSKHQASSVPIHPCASFPVARWCSSTTRCHPIATGTSFPTKRRRRHLRSHRGQLAPSLSTPPRYPSQHYITPVKLPDPSIDLLVQHISFPTIAGIPLHRRRHCPRRLPVTRCVFFQLMVPTRSPCLTGARAQVGCRRSPSEHCRRRRLLHRRLGSSSRSLSPAIPVLDK
jgi:hypothetical protein